VHVLHVINDTHAVTRGFQMLAAASPCPDTAAVEAEAAEAAEAAHLARERRWRQQRRQLERQLELSHARKRDRAKVASSNARCIARGVGTFNRDV
jgi:hypothetical protein